MLFRRISEHVRHQNWTAVVLDFAIVVVGVFIGIQVSNWNEGRSATAREAQLIQDLHRDFLALSNEVAEKSALLQVSKVKFSEFASAVTSEPPELDAEMQREFKETGFNLPPMAAQSATYEQLVSSGDMNLISSKDLRGLLVEHALLTRRMHVLDQQVREWSRPYVVPLVRLTMLLSDQALEKALSGAGSREDLIVALKIHEAVFAQQLALFQEHQASFSTLEELLSAELRRTTAVST
ncbi:hypothetical protein [Chromatocurvus halotolerans]|uniref:Uncharacterized protein n=1 Tax=Chromatocurvus halotolerans TaxID=1132028 RepID=A0A4R2KUS1_9GAMM|nr:hypothetical protein [Chromatocurvus halotolerans]TCO78191.1 hypothetical protein EV688_1013 [Chromatocurvus halotolerans]